MSSSSSSSDSDSDGGSVPPPKVVKKKVVVKRVVVKKAAGGQDASPKLTAEQRASLIMARANANKPDQRSLSSDDEDGPRLPKLPGQASDSSDTSDDDVVVPEFGLDAEAPAKGSPESAEAQKQALREIQKIREQRIALQKDRLAGVNRRTATAGGKGPAIAPPPGGVSSSSSSEDSDDDSDSEMLPNGVEETWIEPLAFRPGLNAKRTRVWLMAMNLPAPLVAKFSGMRSSQLMRLCDADDQSAMIREHGFDGAIFRAAVRQGVRKALEEDGVSERDIAKRLKASGLLGSFGDAAAASGSDSEPEAEQKLKDLVQHRAAEDIPDDGFQARMIQPKVIPSKGKGKGKKAAGSGSSSSGSSSSGSSSSSSSSDTGSSSDDDDSSSSDSDIPLPPPVPSGPPPAEKVVGRLYFADGTHTAHVFLPGLTAAALCQVVFEKQKIKKPELAQHSAADFGLFNANQGEWIPDDFVVLPLVVTGGSELKLVFQLR